MPKVVIETHIRAPIEVCFDLARDVLVHTQTAAHTGERAVGGKTSGLLELGDEITFEATHLFVRQRLTARITQMERPHRFIDEMTRGTFASLRHEHRFEPRNDDTLMTDIIAWKSPLGILGTLADHLFLIRHMRNFLLRRNAKLKEIAEIRPHS